MLIVFKYACRDRSRNLRLLCILSPYGKLVNFNFIISSLKVVAETGQIGKWLDLDPFLIISKILTSGQLSQSHWLILSSTPFKRL